MPIRPPALDDLDFGALVSDLVRRIPAHTPEWTSHQIGDPGRTMIDLFGWLGDAILYRANLVPERQRLAFLRLLGINMRPALPARGLVQLSFDDPLQKESAAFPKLARIDNPMPFELLTEVGVVPVEGLCHIKRKPNDHENNQLLDLMPDLQQLFAIESQATGYVTTPLFAEGKADIAGVDIATDTVDSCLWIALLAPDPDPATVAAVHDALGGGADNRAEVLNIGIAPSLSIAQFGEEIGVREPIAHKWEICTGRGEGNEYLPLDILSDSSAGLVRAGVSRLLLPGKDDIGAPPNDVASEYRAGVGDRPPRIDDPLTAARLVSWIRLRPGTETAPTNLRLSWAGINAVEN